jgi:aldehyde dehydrogenase (NAD+)
MTKLADELLAPPCLIGGAETFADEAIPVEYPYTGEIIGAVPSLPGEAIRDALDLAARASVALDRYERSTVLSRVADRILAESETLARLITLESGLCLNDTRHEVQRAANVFRAAAAEALRDDGMTFAGDIAAGGRARRAHTLREPVRLVAAITPFNHPLNQVAHKLAPALAVGAPIVLKPSEKTPLAALWLGRAAIEAGYPPNAVAVVTGDKQVVLDQFLAHDAVAVVAFTGGVAVGRLIADRLGYRRALLELGGNDPLLVLADADLDEAAALAVTGATANSGQRCTAVKRILADASIADRLADLVGGLAARLTVGDPLDDDTEVGTLIDEAAAAAVESRVRQAVYDGAELLGGGTRTGAQIVPPVLDHVAATSELVREETFGPAVPIVRVSGLDETIAVANGTQYGLSAGVVSNDLDAITRCIRELRCGTVNVREVPGYRTELTPFGGIKSSGLGVKEGVIETMAAFTTTKVFTLPWPRPVS